MLYKLQSPDIRIQSDGNNITIKFDIAPCLPSVPEIQMPVGMARQFARHVQAIASSDKATPERIPDSEAIRLSNIANNYLENDEEDYEEDNVDCSYVKALISAVLNNRVNLTNDKTYKVTLKIRKKLVLTPNQFIKATSEKEAVEKVKALYAKDSPEYEVLSAEAKEMGI